MDKKVVASGEKTCGHCGAIEGCPPGTSLANCARCGLVAYCCKDCQRAHWKAGHKQFCVPKSDRVPPKSSIEPDGSSTAAVVSSAGGEGDCAICLDKLTAGTSTTLPCSHVFHPACVELLRKYGVQNVCPLCRTTLPLGAELLFDKALRAHAQIYVRVQRGIFAWDALPASAEREAQEVTRMLREAANQGHLKAQILLAELTEVGHSAKKDIVESSKWYRKAAVQGDAEAQFIMGIHFTKGRGVKKNFVEAAKWYRKAVDQGHSQAMNNLGVLYEDGKGVKQDSMEALKLYRQSAELGLKDAMYGVGTLYDDGRGVAQDLAEAAKWYSKAAEKGHASAQYNLGNMYLRGNGVERDEAKAIKWLTMSAEQGTSDAQCNLGVLYLYGHANLVKNSAEAVKWLSKAAEQGHPKASVLLAAANKLQGSEPNAQQTQHSSANSPSSLKSCSHCGAVGPTGQSLLACSGCKGPRYCNKSCQLAHWKAGHKKKCASGGVSQQEPATSKVASAHDIKHEENVKVLFHEANVIMSGPVAKILENEGNLEGVRPLISPTLANLKDIQRRMTEANTAAVSERLTQTVDTMVGVLSDL
mmetsp:Transcript_4129/g.8839  ORF Transcript_4129/g.8839 Transcript_4129/m.8839 type:complete len:586 (+) Transcript_4129:3-1760(+)